MRDLAFFRGDIWDLNRKQGREAGITITSGSGSGISCFYGVGMRDSQQEQSGIKEDSTTIYWYSHIDRVT